MEILPNQSARRLVLCDTRTGKYFGGGRADKLFSLWVGDVQQARCFTSPAGVNKVLTELVNRNEHYGVDSIENNPVVGLSIPPYTDKAYVIQEVLIGAPTSTAAQPPTQKIGGQE